MSEQTMNNLVNFLTILFRLIIVLVPVAISWFLRTYVKNTTAQPKIAAIARMANAAIDYAENLDKRGDLPLDPNIRKGAQKLQIASQWLEEELEKNSMSITNDQAQKWVASEFQNRMGGDASKVGNIAKVTKAAVEMIQTMARSNVITIPPEIDRFSYLAGLAADWVVTQMAQAGMQISREESLTWVRAELFQTIQNGDLPTGDQVLDLAKKAMLFVGDLKSKGQLIVRPGSNPSDTELDLATAWVMTEAAKTGIPINPDQIMNAVAAALQQHGSGTAMTLTS
jgi:hypothetical protein